MPKVPGECPYNASNGDLPIAEYMLVLYQNSAKGRYYNHLDGQSCTKHLKFDHLIMDEC
jgi:hypothetical protein